MKKTIKAIRQLQDIIDANKVPYDVEEGMKMLVATYVEEVIDTIEKRAKKIIDSETPDEKKPGLEISISFMLMHGRPFEKDIKSRNKDPKYLNWLNKQYEKVTELEEKSKKKFTNKKPWE